MTAVRTAFIAFLLAAADQLSKHSAAVFLKSKNAVTVFDGFLQLRYVENTGAAFGILGGKNNFLIAFTALVLIFGFAYLFFSKGRDRLFDCALLAALSGGLGNLIDRLFRHFVIDFIEFTFIDFPVFNLADCLVTAGVFIMLIKTLVDFFMQRGREGRKSTKENEDDKTGKA